MSPRLRTVSLVSGLACTALVVPVAGAQASDGGLRTIMRRGLPTITRSQAKVLDGLATDQKTHSPAALIKAIGTQNRDLRTLQSSLSKVSASSPDGRKGKTDIITGLRLIIGSNNTLTAQLKKSAAGKPIAKSRLSAAVSADRKGNRDLNAGAKLLKV